MSSSSDSTTPSAHSSDVLTRLTDQLRDCGRLFHSRGWSVGTSSNYSAVLSNNPIQLLVTASGKDKGRLTQDDFVIVNTDGSPITPNQPKSSAETLLHCQAALNWNAQAILHTHSVWSTILSDLFYNPNEPEKSGFKIEGYEMLKGLEGIPTHETAVWVPIFENTQNIPELTTRVQKYYAKREMAMCHGYLIRRHGLYTWGKSIEAARRHVEIYEFLFEVVGRRLSLEPR